MPVTCWKTGPSVTRHCEPLKPSSAACRARWSWAAAAAMFWGPLPMPVRWTTTGPTLAADAGAAAGAADAGAADAGAVAVMAAASAAARERREVRRREVRCKSWLLVVGRGAAGRPRG
ncbi:hypothetical protein B6R96_05375 [Streptomyces sp. Sge12]|nr:hypothetical protein B6R96_05375 [Streptomyces sp. Sge12]